jgi:hypothetical protein
LIAQPAGTYPSSRENPEGGNRGAPRDARDKEGCRWREAPLHAHEGCSDGQAS